MVDKVQSKAVGSAAVALYFGVRAGSYVAELQELILRVMDAIDDIRTDAVQFGEFAVAGAAEALGDRRSQPTP